MSLGTAMQIVREFVRRAVQQLSTGDVEESFVDGDLFDLWGDGMQQIHHAARMFCVQRMSSGQ